MADPRESKEDIWSYIDTENDDAEYHLAVENIKAAMEESGWSYERAARFYGIRGHPAFADFWPVTRYWGMARLARERLGLPLDE